MEKYFLILDTPFLFFVFLVLLVFLFYSPRKTDAVYCEPVDCSRDSDCGPIQGDNQCIQTNKCQSKEAYWNFEWEQGVCTECDGSHPGNECKYTSGSYSQHVDCCKCGCEDGRCEACPTPTPPPVTPGYENCWRCSSYGWCEVYQVPQGECDTNCNACSGGSDPDPYCTITVSDLTIYGKGGTARSIPSINEYNGADVSSVDYSATPSSYVAISPVQATIEPFETEFTALVSQADVSYSAVASFDGGNCNGTATIHIINPDPWWQVLGGDAVVGENSANLVSKIPNPTLCPDCTFIKDNPLGHPGVPSAGGETDFGDGQVSSKGWVVEDSSYEGMDPFTYEYFERKIPIGVNPILINDNTFDQTDLGNCDPNAGKGYCWYKYEGNGLNDLVVEDIGGGVSLDNKKVVLFVKNADLVIKSKISAFPGLGGFYAIVEGDRNNSQADAAIRIDPSVGDLPASRGGPDIQGVFFTEGTFSTGSQGDNSDLQLYIRGSVFANQFNLQRDLPNNSANPAEVFEFAPDLILNWPPFLSGKNITWQEVSP